LLPSGSLGESYLSDMREGSRQSTLCLTFSQEAEKLVFSLPWRSHLFFSLFLTEEKVSCIFLIQKIG